MSTHSTLERTTSTSGTSNLDSISSDIGLLVLRVVFGALLAGHGAQKLFGWFDGMGLSANADAFDSMGYNPGKFFGTLAGLSEFTGGLLLLAGLLTPLASAIMLGTMINAINATWSGGLLTDKGYELGLLFATVAVDIACTGPGKFSLDNGRPWARQGFIWGVGAVALGVIGAVITLIFKDAL
jgi:putative oxidoreductase